MNPTAADNSRATWRGIAAVCATFLGAVTGGPATAATIAMFDARDANGTFPQSIASTGVIAGHFGRPLFPAWLSAQARWGDNAVRPRRINRHLRPQHQQSGCDNGVCLSFAAQGARGVHPRPFASLPLPGPISEKWRGM
jgi:hypothetical protein